MPKDVRRDSMVVSEDKLTPWQIVFLVTCLIALIAMGYVTWTVSQQPKGDCAITPTSVFYYS